MAGMGRRLRAGRVGDVDGLAEGPGRRGVARRGRAARARGVGRRAAGRGGARGRGGGPAGTVRARRRRARGAGLTRGRGVGVHRGGIPFSSSGLVVRVRCRLGVLAVLALLARGRRGVARKVFLRVRDRDIPQSCRLLALAAEAVRRLRHVGRLPRSVGDCVRIASKRERGGRGADLGRGVDEWRDDTLARSRFAAERAFGLCVLAED
jgi:hypothetical protein